MNYWLTYEAWGLCSHPRIIRVVQSESRPDFALDGPCDDPQCLLERMRDFFEFDSDGFMRLRLDRNSE